MSAAEERREAWEQGVRNSLRPDVGAVDDGECGCHLCDEDAVYRVPWPHIGGDVAYCPFHLARYRDRHGDIYARVRDVDGAPDPEEFATVGDRFLAVDEIPERFAAAGEELLRVALAVDGRALAYSAEPDGDGFITVALVSRSLDVDDSVEIHRDSAGEFLVWFRDHQGWHGMDPGVREQLYGGEF